MLLSPANKVRGLFSMPLSIKWLELMHLAKVCVTAQVLYPVRSAIRLFLAFPASWLEVNRSGTPFFNLVSIADYGTASV